MKRMNSRSDLALRPAPVGEHDFLDEGRSRSRSAPPKPPRTFSRIKAEKKAQVTNNVTSSDFNDSSDGDISGNFTALIEKSFEQLEITQSARTSACDTMCLREWVLRMCLLEKLEKSALNTLDAVEVTEDKKSASREEGHETREEGYETCEDGHDTREDQSGWLSCKLMELAESPKKRRRFSSKFFRNLSPSRLILKQKQRKERKQKKRRAAMFAKKKDGEKKNEGHGMNLSRVHGFFFRTFWKDGKKHTEL